MFRIRRVHGQATPRDREAVAAVQRILREQFADVDEEEVRALPVKLVDPLKYRYRSLLYVAEDHKGNIKGFALLLHAPDLRFCYLDYIAAATKMTGRGVGGALYERVREEARDLGVVGLFYECLPDNPRDCCDPTLLKQNISRLRFYERYGARPISGTLYELPVKPGDKDMPHLVYDDLGQKTGLPLEEARKIVQAILQRKYVKYCPPDYIEKVVESFQDDPVRLRPFRYIGKELHPPTSDIERSIDQRVALIVNDRHEIHHVRERGYVESPVRIKSILSEIGALPMFQRIEPRHFPERHLKTVHDADFVDYLKKCCTTLETNKSVYPYVFPIRNGTRPPKELAVRAGYYCIDTFTPLNRSAYEAAKRSVDCALTGSHLLLEGYRCAYALVRPPGHHAERRAFGGFCYFNSAAIAADDLARFGKVAVLDIDYHHGNGTQDIFYSRSDVLTISIHGHPRFAYPYFSGFEEEQGTDEGMGYNKNYPLPENMDGPRYRETLENALRRISRFHPAFLVVALGLDPAKGDPTGTWNFRTNDFQLNGRMIGRLNLPTLVVQEGGYRTRSLGTNAREFFSGLMEKHSIWEADYRKTAIQKEI